MEQLVLQLEGASMAWWRYLFTIHNETVKWEWRPLHTAGVYISQRWIFMNHGVMTCSVIGSNISNDTAGIKSLHIHAVGQYFLAVLFFFPSLPSLPCVSPLFLRKLKCIPKLQVSLAPQSIAGWIVAQWKSDGALTSLSISLINIVSEL